MLSGGGCGLGEIVTIQLADGAMLTWTYVTDPEGNVIALQSRPTEHRD